MREKDLKESLKRLSKQVEDISKVYKSSTESINLPKDVMKDVDSYISSLKGSTTEQLNDLLSLSPEKLEDVAKQILKNR